MPHLIQTVRRPDAAWRARFVALTTFVVAAACDQPPDTLPTSPESHGIVVNASVVILPTLGGVSTSAVDINELGEVVGSGSTGQANHAFLWAPGLGMRDLGTLGGGHSFAIANQQRPGRSSAPPTSRGTRRRTRFSGHRRKACKTSAPSEEPSVPPARTTRGLAVTASGVAAGFVLYAIAAPFLRASLYGVTTSDPVTLTGVTLALVATASVASWLPARRAHVDPAEALRAE